MVTSDYRIISYNETGKGTPLVLIHAFPADKRLWKPQQEGLKKYFRVITLDLWGFGHSSAADGLAITMTEYAEEVKELLDYLGIKKAIIGGESMGGYVALAFLEKYPDTVQGLVLSNTQAIADTSGTKKKREAIALDVLEHGKAPFIKVFMPKALSINALERVKIYLRGILMTQSPLGIASAERGMALRPDSTELLAQSKLPVLIITGELDVLISPEQSKRLHALAKNSNLILLNHAGHLSNLEQSGQWNQAIIEHFKS